MSQEQTSAGQTKDEPSRIGKKKGLGRRMLKWGLIVLAALVVLVALAPTICSTGPVRNLIVSAVNKGIRGKIQMADMSLGWFSSCSVDGLAVSDPEGRKALTVKRVALSKGLMSLLVSRKDFGQIDVEAPLADLYLDAEGKNSLARAFEPVNPQPAPAAKQSKEATPTNTTIVLGLTGGRIRVVNVDGVEYVMDDLSGKCQVKTLNDIVASFSGSTGGGKFSLNADVKNVFSSGKASLDTAGGEIKMLTDPAIDMQPIISFCTKGVRGTGKLGVDVRITLRPGKTSGTWAVSMDGLSARAADSDMTVSPTDLHVTGGMEYAAKKLQATMNVDGPVAAFKSVVEYAASETQGPADSEKSGDMMMDGKAAAMPEFNLTASGKIDLAAAGRCIPGLLALRKDVRITSGAIELSGIKASGGKRPAAQGAMKAYATVVRGSTTKIIDPIDTAFKLTTDADGTVRVEQANLTSAFSQAQASGTLSQLDASVKVNLDAAHKQFTELFDLDKIVMSGTLSATLKVAKESPTAKKINMALTLNADQVRVGAVSEGVVDAATAAKAAPAPAPATFTGQLVQKVDLEKIGKAVSAQGTLEIVKLSTSDMGDLLPGDRPMIAYQLSMDSDQQQAKITRFTVASKILTLDIAGRVTKLDTDKILDLAGKYSASWPELTTLARRFSPEGAKTVAMQGQSQGNITITGSARQPEIRPEFRQVKGGTAVGWGNGSKVYGMTLGDAKLEPSFKEAQMILPTTAISANGGTIRLGCMADFQGEEPVLRIDGKLDVLENVALNEDLGREILSRALPLLAEMNKLDGKVSLQLQDVQVPLSAKIKKVGRGRGHLDLSGIQMRPAGQMARLMQLLGLSSDKPYPVKISPVDFELKDGGLRYENLTLTFGDKFDVKFHGMVKFDDSVDLVMSLPVKPELLSALGVKGPIGQYAQVLEGSRIDVPLVGSRLNPRMDLAKVDIKPLMAEATKKLATGKLLPDLLGPKPKGTPGGPTTKPADQFKIPDLLK